MAIGLGPQQDRLFYRSINEIHIRVDSFRFCYTVVRRTFARVVVVLDEYELATFRYSGVLMNHLPRIQRCWFHMSKTVQSR